MAENLHTLRPRRSCLYMPGSNARAMEKAKNLAADCIILDLEDAVAPEAKVQARQAVCDMVAKRPFGHRETVIRINAHGSEWGRDDLMAAVRARPDAILVPKITSADDIPALNVALAAAGADDTLALWVMIEMPLAILNIASIAATARSTRLAAFVMGTNDLAKEMLAIPTPDRAAFHTALSLSVTAARAHGLAAIDGVYNDISDNDGLRAECEQGRIMGFEGKTLIHPAQLETCNTVFSPDDREIAEAHAIITAFEEPANKGKGVLKVNGKMAELLHLEQARRTAAIAEAIAAIT
ncbi:CoA ester lyase [Sphingorhabdus sp. Alg239-R122]|uniref:HpcH/HpaI aldolase/citrate lyase family protein n=1 Tax=Sphingorhabdus sp. Alg239-R122 TaxID=2305989 RepID=UPI0013DC268E|nr:CoA ester lyase [Sphingorhabdus sp. Alg239-R122]